MATVAESLKVAGSPDQEQAAVGSWAPGWPKAMTPPRSLANPSPNAQDSGWPMLTWVPAAHSLLPTSVGAAATCTEGSGSWGRRSGTICRHTSPFPLFCSKACSEGLSGSFSFSLCDSLSPSQSLPFFPTEVEVGCPASTAALSSVLQGLPPGGGARGPSKA